MIGSMRPKSMRPRKGRDTGRAIVLIISHKPVLTRWELISLRQCVRVLGRHPMTFICPDGLDTTWYRTFVPEIPIEHVDRRWLATFSMFASLKISPLLYEKYEQFEYILFYEPDAFVFSDRLEEWCDRGLDYLGAPWFEGFSEPKSDRIIGAGNGGFSLRKVQSHLRIAKRFELERALLSGGYRRHPSQKLWFLLAQVSRKLGIGKGRRYYVSPAYDRSEDVFWAFTAPRRDPSFRVAPPDLALSFSFEVKPRLLYEMNSHRLPFGCHAWFKYDLAFWKPFIEGCGYDVPDESVLVPVP
jgi:hypothetical protein